MARMSVYVPDALLARARSEDPSANTSQLVQRGLELLAGPPASYALRPADARELVDRARQRLEPVATAEFQRGYRRASEVTDEAFFSELDNLARLNFNVRLWAERWRQSAGYTAAGLDVSLPPGFYPPSWWVALADGLGALVDPIGIDEYSFQPSQAFVNGYEAALRDIWESLEHGPVTGHD